MAESLEPCPFLVEITEAYCGGSPRKKLIPLERMSEGSPCTGEGYRECPVYRELRARERGAAPEGGEDAAPARGR